MAGAEYKVAKFADDVLVFMEESEKSFIGLMTMLEDCRKTIKFNVLKTQEMSLNT